MLSPEQKLADLLEWLYTKDASFPSRKHWREALIAKLKEVLGVVDV